MGTFSHLIVAVDGSEPSQRAVAFSLKFAAREGARISFCSVVDPAAEDVAAAEGAPVFIATTISALREQARVYCLEAMTRAAAAGVGAASVVLDGDVSTALEQFVEQHDVGAIVVGTHGRKGFTRAVLGSVACSIVRGARVPVFTIRADAAVDAQGPIAVAVDGSRPSLAALHVAIALARSQQTTLHLVHVFDERDLALIHEHPGYDPAIARRQALAGIADVLEEISDHVRAAGAAFTSEMCEGDPVAETIAASARVKARFIATETHVRSAFGRLVSGSFAEALMHDAPIPVMTVRAASR